MKTLLGGLLLLAFVASAAPESVSVAQTAHLAASAETAVTGAAEGSFPPGASLSGVSLSGSRSGIGVIVQGDGGAAGTFSTVLIGTSVLGQPREIAIDGRVTSGSSNIDGSVTFSGLCTLDLGDGTLPASDVPFTVTVTGSGALTLVVGLTTLPAQALAAGSITIE